MNNEFLCSPCGQKSHKKESHWNNAARIKGAQMDFFPLHSTQNYLLGFLIGWGNLILTNPDAVVSVILRWGAIQMLSLKALICIVGSQSAGVIHVVGRVSWKLDYRYIQEKSCEYSEITNSNTFSFFGIKPIIVQV